MQSIFFTLISIQLFSRFGNTATTLYLMIGSGLTAIFAASVLLLFPFLTLSQRQYPHGGTAGQGRIVVNCLSGQKTR